MEFGSRENYLEGLLERLVRRAWKVNRGSIERRGFLLRVWF